MTRKALPVGTRKGQTSETLATRTGDLAKARSVAPRLVNGSDKKHLITSRADAVRLAEAAGITDPTLAARFSTQLLCLQSQQKRWGNVLELPADQLYEQTVALFRELAPKNVTQCMMAIQIAAIHEAHLSALYKANIPEQPLEFGERYTNLSIRLGRLFDEKSTAYAKLQGTLSQQRVIVERVTVEPGGKAIVGAVAALTTGGAPGVS